MRLNKKIITWLCSFMLFIPAFVLLGWMFHNEHLKRVLPELVQMNPLTAVLFILSAVTVLLLQHEKRTFPLLTAILITFTASWVFMGFYTPLSFAPDLLLFTSQLGSNRMAPNTALNFLLTGFAMLLLTLGYYKKAVAVVVQVLSLLALGISLLALIGYLYASLSLYRVENYSPMAIHSAICFLLLTSSLLLLQPHMGMMAVIFDHYDGGKLARKLLPIAVLAPILLGWIRLLGQKYNFYGHEFGTALLIIFIISVFAIVVWLQARKLNRSDAERRTSELELIKAKEIAEDAKRSQEQFLANMSHEIRTPMNGVIGMTNLLRGTSLDTTQAEYVETINESAANLLVIINDILDFNKITSGKLVFEKIDFTVRDVVTSVIRICQYRATEKGLQLECHFEDELNNTYQGDPVRLNQILLNLVSNAIKFTDKGKVSLSVAIASDLLDHSLLRFKVSDTGIGIPEDQQEAIFESFKQATEETTRKYGGTGLGLTITRQLIELLHGTITVSSALGQGAVFVVEITYRKGQTDIQKLISRNTQGADASLFHNLQVLLVEDNKINQRVAVYTMQKWGARVDVAENGNECIRMLDKKKYDVVLMDLQMPEMDGFETTEFIRRHMKEPINSIPIIAMTASAMSTEKERCLKNGMNDYLSKPFNVADLQNKIRSVTGGMS